MTRTIYNPYGVTLTIGQIKKIKNAHNKKLDVTIKISKNNLTGNDKLHLTELQINKIKKATDGVQLKLSRTQLDHMEKVGGFLPLLAAIPAILGAIGGLTGGVASAVNSSRQVNEQIRHNQEIEKAQREQTGNGFLQTRTPLKSVLTKLGVGKSDISKISKGGCIGCDGFNIKKIGNGLYLEPQGSGLFLGPSPGSWSSSTR
jgi:iron only hydrogenase large subunit-like protein